METLPTSEATANTTITVSRTGHIVLRLIVTEQRRLCIQYSHDRTHHLQERRLNYKHVDGLVDYEEAVRPY